MLQIEHLYKVKGTILLTGETGTGKSYLAKKIHQNSFLRNHKFISVHLVSLSDNLIESELFGHIRGAFTGAIGDKKGLLEEVGMGTLFLDEIGDLSLSSQKKLLEVLEERTFQPVGSIIKKKFIGRVIAATHKNLDHMIKEGTFRQDLFFRLRIFNYELPPLRNDIQKVQEIILTLFEEFKVLFQKPHMVLEEKCFLFLKNHNWHGNIRELKHCLEYAFSFADKEISIKSLPDWLRSPVNTCEKNCYPKKYYEALGVFEMEYLTNMLRKYNGVINKTAENIGLSKSTFVSKLRKYGINVYDIKSQEYRERL